MGLFRTDFREELQGMIDSIDKVEIPKNWRWWSGRDEKLKDIEKHDVEIIGEIKKLHKAGHTNTELSRMILGLAIELRNALQETYRGDYSDKQRQRIEILMEEINAFLQESLTLESISLEEKPPLLYHGTNVPGMQSLKLTKENTTLGYGVYLTDKSAASHYALLRVKSRRKGIATVYEVQVPKVRLADLRDDHNVRIAAEPFRRHVLHLLETSHEKENLMHLVMMRHLQAALKALSSVHHGNIRELFGEEVIGGAGPLQEDWTKLLISHGFDGLIAMEGGEAGFGNHVTYLLFDGEKCTVKKEIHVTQPL